MTPRGWGFLTSRALAIVGLFILSSAFVSFVHADGLAFNLNYPRNVGWSSWLDVAVHALYSLGLLWLIGNLWFRAKSFVHLPASDTRVETTPVDATRLIHFGLGLYFVISASSALIFDWVYTRNEITTFLYRGPWRVAESGFQFLSGLTILIIAKRPSWLMAIASWPRNDIVDEDENAQPGQP